jgi:hypothetical protein
MPEQLQALQSQVSANHRRVISVRLRVLEDSCLRLLDLFLPHEASMTARSPLPQENAAEISRLVADLTAKIAQVKSDLTLEQAFIDARREASAIVSAMSVDLEELYPRFLGGYGKVPPLLAHYLDNKIGECLDVIGKIHRELGIRAGPPAESED